MTFPRPPAPSHTPRNLTKPVLLEKTPVWWGFPIEELHAAFMTFNDTADLAASDGSSNGADSGAVLATVTPVYVVMYRPICISILSSHFKKKGAKYITGKKRFHGHEFANRTLDEVRFEKFASEVDRIEDATAKFKWALSTEGVKMVAINYADLLWRPRMVSDRLKDGLPCISNLTFDSSFVSKGDSLTAPGEDVPLIFAIAPPVCVGVLAYLNDQRYSYSR